MAIFNLIVRIVFFVCIGWSVLVLIYFFIRRGIERRKAKKEIKEELTNEDSVTTEDSVEKSAK